MDSNAGVQHITDLPTTLTPSQSGFNPALHQKRTKDAKPRTLYNVIPSLPALQAPNQTSHTNTHNATHTIPHIPHCVRAQDRTGQHCRSPRGHLRKPWTEGQIGLFRFKCSSCRRPSGTGQDTLLLLLLLLLLPPLLLLLLPPLLLLLLLPMLLLPMLLLPPMLLQRSTERIFAESGSCPCVLNP